MTKAEARKIHAHFEAAIRLTVVIPCAIYLTGLAFGRNLADTLAVTAFALCFCAVMSAVSVDVISKRIPNGISLAALISAPLWWIAYAAGSEIPAVITDGIVLDIMGWVYGQDITGSVLPVIASVSYPWRILLDIAMMLVVFVPLYFSFAFGLGFGGGDVKLMTAASLFFGWPLGLDFFFLTFLIGGVFSVGVILGRISSRIAIRAGLDSERLRKMSTTREFPFAPAIGFAAILCFALKLQGLH